NGNPNLEAQAAGPGAPRDTPAPLFAANRRSLRGLDQALYPFSQGQSRPGPSGGGEASGWRHPRDMGAAEVRQFLEHLSTDRNVAAPTQDQALNALVFLYHGVLK